MLAFYHRLALWLHGCRRALWIVAGCAIAVFCAAIFLVPGHGAGAYAFSSLTLLMGAICLLTIAYSFRAPVPGIDPGARWTGRLKVRTRRACLWLMAALMTALSAMVVFMTLRALGIWMRGA